MKIAVWSSIVSLLIISSHAGAQRLKKADRQVVEHLSSHIRLLSNATPADYIISQLKKSNCTPETAHADWLQQYTIDGGRLADSSTYFSVNGHRLVRGEQFFPFAFSANKSEEASVSIALAERGAPWFLDTRDIFDGMDDNSAKDTATVIAQRARRAAEKGATALIIFNRGGHEDLASNPLDTQQRVSIPVVYITGPATKAYLQKETTALDISLQTSLHHQEIKGKNIVGLLDNHAKTTTLVTAPFSSDSSVAELLELAHIFKSKSYRWTNFVFLIYSPEDNGIPARKYFERQRVSPAQPVNYTLDLDRLTDHGLPGVRQSEAALNDFRSHETQTRP